MVLLKTDYLQLWFLYNSDLRISNVRKQDRKKLASVPLWVEACPFFKKYSLENYKYNPFKDVLYIIR